ncbi:MULTISPECIES: VirB8/TrbF family protein [unclassified Saccharopolyspora]|uniref:VirB8/TrbF family protein n=1 Tax=unclassified Saccharopolyspora TaxID=2646250 RepID=UPI001CD74535|nr:MULTISPECIES: VirB8/TrbF family protein [unclassified Saccharopolyspora]MCA1190461.1 hypothetical protein [Saccharopolyspora sp. 6T]MCA1224782.1 hypothetical protein [Saccharopolyspora sp. 6M]
MSGETATGQDGTGRMQEHNAEPVVESTAESTAGSAAEPAVESAGESAAEPIVESTEDTTAAGAASGTPEPARRRRPGGRAVLAAAVVLLLLGGLATTGWLLHRRATEDAARAGALAAGREYALALTTYDHQDLAGNFDRVAQHSSPAFARQYQEVSDGLTQLIQQYQATSKGEVLHAGVAESSTDRAVLLLFVDQTITNTNSPEPRVDRTRMRLTLVHSGDQWFIDDVQLI